MAVERLSQASVLTLNKYSSMMAGSTYIPGSFELISTTIPSGSVSQIDLSLTGLSATYKHLQIRIVGRTSGAFTTSDLRVRFNTDTTSTYSTHTLWGNTAMHGDSSLTTFGQITDYFPAASAVANSYSVSVTDLLDCFNSTTYKQYRTLSGAYSDGGSSAVKLASGSWRNTAALSTISIFAGSTPNFTTASRISLYGVRG